MDGDWRERIKNRAAHSAWCFVAGLIVTIVGLYLWLGCTVMWIGCLGCSMAMAIGPLVIWASVSNAWEAWGDYRWESKRRSRWTGKVANAS